ncbi:MAG: UDP-N-acetylmuramate dehydrogenase [Defluviitaleaceae bacterium]|nr:UDP-N-acetylmuramate dehydrogenase [Defluviitaleaceae bacterium]
MTIIDAITTDYLTDEPMSRHTSFKIGGKADILAFPSNTDTLVKLYKLCQENGIPITILGDGTNVLVSDDGIRGVVVFTNKMNEITIRGNKIHAQSGVRLSALTQAACEAGLDGLVFASGIPGTVGGAIYMNAGAYDHDISEVCEAVTLFEQDKIVTKTNAEMLFGYRKSYTQKGDVIILEAVFDLAHGDTEKIRQEMHELNQKREESQPLEVYSAGSFFKRPEGNYAGKLIRESGLKGYSVGDAQISEKHAGFVINKGNATAKDILSLMRHVQKTVYERFGVHLEPEVRLLGF